MPAFNTVNKSVVLLISAALFLEDKWPSWNHACSCKICVLSLTSGILSAKFHLIAALYYSNLSAHEADVSAAMHRLCNNLNFRAVLDNLDLTNIKMITINHHSRCSQIVFLLPDKLSRWFKWINVLST